MSGEVPEGWSVQRLDGLLTVFRNGFSCKQSKVQESGTVPVSRIETISSGQIDVTRLGFTPYSPKVESYKIIRGDILFSHINSIEHVGKTAFAKSDMNFYHAMNLMLLRADNTKILSNFLFEILNWERSRDHFREHSKKAVNQVSLNKENIGSLTISLPPLPEQQRIAEILSSVDESIRATEAVIAQAERVKRGLMEDLLTGGLGSAAIANGEVPEGWEEQTFEEAFFVRNDKSKQIQKIDYTDDGFFPIIDQGASFIAGYANGEPNRNFPVIIFGDHTRCVKWVDQPFFAGADGTQAIYPSEGIDPRFGYFLMSAVDLPNLGYSRHMRELKRCKFLIPPLPEQQRIAEILSSVDTQITTNRTTVEQLQHLKRGLMDDLLTGKVRALS